MPDFPVFDLQAIPHVTSSQMRDVDRLMTERFGISLPQMMEQAGLHLATVASDLVPPANSRPSVVFLAGSGGNGGGALVCARHLHNRGYDVLVSTTRPVSRMGVVPGHQAGILLAMDVPFALSDKLSALDPPSLIIDGIIGYGLRGSPVGPAATMIGWANSQRVPVVSLDVPSGLDPDTGEPGKFCVRADRTMTLALPKTGLVPVSAANVTGSLFCADISVPPELYALLSPPLQVQSLFRQNTIVRLVRPQA